MQNDIMTHKASFDEVSEVRYLIRKRHISAAKKAGIPFLKLLQNEALMQAAWEEQERACILMGWSIEVHEQEDHERILRSMQEDQ